MTTRSAKINGAVKRNLIDLSVLIMDDPLVRGAYA
jgi:hypothetical protein